MKTNAELAAELLRQGAAYFRAVGEYNPPIKDEINEKAKNVETVASRVEEFPEVAVQFLRESASFFRHVGEQNPPLSTQMESNARAFEAVAALVEEDPMGEAPTARAGEEAPESGETPGPSGEGGEKV